MQHYNEFIALRLPSEQREKIESLIQQGKFKNISQVIRTALKQFLQKTGRGAVSKGTPSRGTHGEKCERPR